jgi:hypothetical protein
MLITVQHPFADSRQFCPGPIRVITRPTWPSPLTDEFVRGFGGIEKRKLGGLDFWGEDLLCNAVRGIRFDPLPPFRRRNRSFVTLDACFRRLYCDGSALGKVEIGLATRGRHFRIDHLTRNHLFDMFCRSGSFYR